MRYAKENKMKFIEVSAKTGHNIGTLFSTVLRKELTEARSKFHMPQEEDVPLTEATLRPYLRSEARTFNSLVGSTNVSLDRKKLQMRLEKQMKAVHKPNVLIAGYTGSGKVGVMLALNLTT